MINEKTVAVSRVGQTFHITVYGFASTWNFKIRSQSRRRYLVVSLDTQRVVRRSDNVATAKRATATKSANDLGAVVLDTVTGELV